MKLIKSTLFTCDNQGPLSFGQSVDHLNGNTNKMF